MSRVAASVGHAGHAGRAGRRVTLGRLAAGVGGAARPGPGPDAPWSDADRAPPRASGTGVGRWAAAIGRPMRAAAGRPVDPVADRQAGRGVVATLVVAVVVHPVAAALVPVSLGVVAWRRTRLSRAERAAALVASLPDVVDLLSLAVGTGASPRLAVEAVARHGRGPLADAFSDVLVDVDQRGARLADRLAGLVVELDPVVALVVHPLVAAERYGTPLAPALALVGSDLRQLRRHRAEEAIRRVPVKLIFPLVFCTLPAFGVLTLIPLLAASLRHLEH